MATKAQIEEMLVRFERVRPAQFFKCFDETQAGIGAALRLLDEASDIVTAGKISDELNISTARVAVLLKKMAAKGLIVKEHSNDDARITVVQLTDVGASIIKEMRDEMYQQMGRVIDAVGEERLIEFIDITSEIQHVLSPPEFRLL